MTLLMKNKALDERIKRFVLCNSKMRERTLESEREFLKLAGNISPAQLHIILSIGENSPCTMSQLAKILHFSKPNITQMIERLIQKKMVKKVKHATDQRSVEVILLSIGKKISDLHKAHVERVAKSWFTNMSEPDQEAMLKTWEKYLD